jgi:hypothetical protein
MFTPAYYRDFYANMASDGHANVNNWRVSGKLYTFGVISSKRQKPWGHPRPAIMARAKAKGDLDAGRKTPVDVTTRDPDASCHRASRKKTGHTYEIVREQLQLGEDAFAFVHSPTWLALSAPRLKSRQEKTVSKGCI